MTDKRLQLSKLKKLKSSNSVGQVYIYYDGTKPRSNDFNILPDTRGQKGKFLVVGDSSDTEVPGQRYVLSDPSVGTGNVVGSGTDTLGQIVKFNNDNGTIITNAGFSIATPQLPDDLGKVLSVGANGHYIPSQNNNGDVSGPDSSLPGSIAVFSDTTGKIVGSSNISFPIPISAGGTGQSSAAASLNSLLERKPLPIAQGGTGQSSAIASLDALLEYKPLPIEQGGTGQSSATASLNSLLEYKPLPIAKGGTGATSLSDALTSLGIPDPALSAANQAVVTNGTGGYVLYPINSSGGGISEIVTSSPLSGGGSFGKITINLGNVPLGKGGTGLDLSYIPKGSLLYADQTGSLTILPPGNENQVLKMSSSGVPVWDYLEG